MKTNINNVSHSPAVTAYALVTILSSTSTDTPNKTASATPPTPLKRSNKESILLQL